MSSPLSLKWSTILPPEEYDIEWDMQRIVKLANTGRLLYISMDVGKLIGLYQAWKELGGKEAPREPHIAPE